MTYKLTQSNKMTNLQHQKSLINRFHVAYTAFNKAQRRVAKTVFCDTHGVTPGTFRNKMSGDNPLYEKEVEWMETFNPYVPA